MIGRRPCSPALAVLVSLALVVSCSRSAPPQETTVRALWYGTQDDGTIASGITPVVVRVERGPGRAFTVDRSALDAAGAGATWEAAAWSAATIGTLLAEVDPRGIAVSYGLEESIDGPSAGGALTVGVLADLADAGVRPSATMTGTVLPSGGIGPVGGIPEKLRAAHRAGITTVAIPRGQRSTVDPVTRSQVDVVEEGRRLGIEVVEVATVGEAYALLVGPRAPQPANDVGPLPPPVVERLEGRTRRALDRLAGLDVRLAPGPDLAEARDRIAAGRRLALERAPELLAVDPSTAYARATLAERSVLAWNALVDASTVEGVPAVVTVPALQDRADAVARSAAEGTARTARTRVATLEQLIGLADAVSWATDAGVVAETSSARLAGALGPADPGRVAADLAAAGYDLDEYLPASIEVLEVVGRIPLADHPDAVGRLATYADLLGQAGEANDEYYERAVRPTAPSEDDTEVARTKALGRRWQQLVAAGGDDQAAVVARLSTATSYFVAGTTIVTTTRSTGPTGAGADADARLRISDPTAFSTQVEVATSSTAATASRLAARGVDTSYLRWNSAWGRAVATAPVATGATDQLRLEGLQLQWYGNVQGSVLATSTGP